MTAFPIPAAGVIHADWQKRISQRVDSNWLQDYYDALPAPLFGSKRPIEDYRDAYLFGASSHLNNRKPFYEVCHLLKEAWNDLIGPSVLEWEDAEPVVEHAYTRFITRPSRVPKHLLVNAA